MITVAHDIKEEAFRWAARRLSREMTAKDERALQRWLEADPRHREALKTATQPEDYLDDVAAAFAVDEGVRELTEQSADKLSDRVVPLHRASLPPCRRLFQALAAGTAFLFAAAALVATEFKSASTEQYASAIGEQRSVQLRDGSSVHLNTNSRLSVTYSGDRRALTLASGEALFDVEEEPERPFVVSTPNAEVIVTGTVFNVRSTADETLIGVVSGSVDVVMPNQPPVALQGGETVTVSNRPGADINVGAFDVEALLAWRSGEAHYEEEALGDVVSDLNRYFDQPIVLADASVGALPVTGRFDIKDQETTVEALAVAFSLTAKSERGRIVLTREKS